MRGWSAPLGLAWALPLALGMGAVADADETVWQTYHSDSGGFSVSVPASWVASAQTNADGTAMISLDAPDNTAGISIAVQSSADASAVDDLPNTRCQPITAGGQPGTRCTDTLSFASTISVPVGDRLYQIVASERRLGAEVLQALLASFSFDQAVQSPAAAPPQPTGPTTIAPPAALPMDCGVSGGGLGRPKPLCPMP